MLMSLEPLAAATFVQLTGEPGEYVSGGNSYYFTRSDGTFAFQTQFDKAITIQFRQTSPPYHWFDLTFKPYPGERLEPGIYPDATRWPFQIQRPGLTVAGDGRGCNMSSGNFEVISSTYDANGNIQSLHVRFEQFCESPSAPRLSGEALLEADAVVPTLSEWAAMLLVIALGIAGAFVMRTS